MKPLTKNQLLEYFQVYRNVFPDWTVEHDTVLARTNGPVKQVIAFQSLRSGAYRSSCSIDLLLPIPDGCQILYQLLDKHSDVFPRQHPDLWQQVVKRMEEQFIPPVRMRLDANETLQYAEQSVKPYGGDVGINCSTGLAALNAYLGESERALYWCSQVEVKAASMGRELADWEISKRQFTSELREVVSAGKARDFLESGS